MMHPPAQQHVPSVWEAVGIRMMREHTDPADVTAYLTHVHHRQTHMIGA